MKLNGYRCDNCCKEQPIHPLSTNGVPFGWFTVKLAVFLFPQMWVFCSKSCLSQWSSKQLEEVKVKEVNA